MRRKGELGQLVLMQSMLRVVRLLERRYLRFFPSEARYAPEPDPRRGREAWQRLERLGIRLEHTGESFENLLKVQHLAETRSDIALFVQASPSFCCPSLVTEGMAEVVQELTGVPLVSVTYDGTEGDPNDVVAPYLRFGAAGRRGGGPGDRGGPGDPGGPGARRAAGRARGTGAEEPIDDPYRAV
jgi:hypothetical protein